MVHVNERGVSPEARAIVRSSHPGEESKPLSNKRNKNEIHVHFSSRTIRLYTRLDRTGKNFSKIEYTKIIASQLTEELARNHRGKYFRISRKIAKSPHKLKNFVLFCAKREIGFHSKVHTDNTTISGRFSKGCVRLQDEESHDFYRRVEVGDSVRLFFGSNQVRPTFENRRDKISECEK